MNKRNIVIAAMLLPLLAAAEGNSGRLHISDLNVNKGESQLTLNMKVDPKGYRVKGNNIVTLTPMLVAEDDTLSLQPVRIAGKGAWYAEIRDGKSTPLTLLRAGKDNASDYSCTVPFTPAFDKSRIVIKADTASICNCNPPAEGIVPVADLDFRTFTPEFSFRYVAPKDTADKIFDLSGRANIIFKVNRTDIDWSYFSNRAELDSIVATINAVRDNEYATVEHILLTGYASPEGPYANNVRLAKGRTEAVKEYVRARSTFPESVYDTSSVPEDWDGLRAWIADSSLPQRDAMLAFIDDPSIPIEKKNDLFRARFPEEYPFLLKSVYPVLRHTDYRITYKIRSFYDIDEIEKVFRTNPRILSLNELYLLAGKYAPGSPEYDRVFTVAANMYPDSDVANLNAAGSAMALGNLQSARTYLAKVKESPESAYALGILSAKEGDYTNALQWLRKAADARVDGAAEAIAEVEKAMAPSTQIVIL
ncbi:MAG: DUF3868 domain-containing protein [Bacteroides sp.]|nr:DUF3868 domain-containing protein [Bacteroides sp.]